MSSSIDWRTSRTFSSFDLPVELKIKLKINFKFSAFNTIGLIEVAYAKDFVIDVLILGLRKMYWRSHAFRTHLEDLDLVDFQ
jgi:hypothetical protein